MNHGDVTTTSDVGERRSFLIRATAVVVSGILVLFPFAAGFGVLFHPLRRLRKHPAETDDPLDTIGFVRVCSLDTLPADGTPREFVVTADVADAWTRTAGQRIGSVFLERSEANGQPNVLALSSVCPHLGCAVEYDGADSRFECPCHDSAFAKDGAKLFGPSLRGLDPLPVKLVGSEGAGEVWVEYERFRAGIAERIPVG